MTKSRVNKLLRLVQDSNTGYLLVSGGGEGFLELPLMCQIIEGSAADVTWMVTSGFWAKSEQGARRVLRDCREAHEKNIVGKASREIVIRISVDQHHIDRLGSLNDPLDYIRCIIRVFEQDHLTVPGFSLMLHSLQGEESVIQQLADQVGATLEAKDEGKRDSIKITESEKQLVLPSGWKIPVTFAKLLLSDMAADLRDKESLARRVEIWERDAYVNEHDRTGLQLHEGGFGHDMLVVYDGRVAGGWQCEMPDIPINIDNHNYNQILARTLSDPGVLATIEKGQRYRFQVIEEVSVKACTRAKAVNIRDYTSPILLEEDRIKLYYTVRAIQDMRDEGRTDLDDKTDIAVRRLLDVEKGILQTWFRESNYDIIQQLREFEEGFLDFECSLIDFSASFDREKFSEQVVFASNNNLRRVDKWRLLLLRIERDWYDISSWSSGVLESLSEAVDAIDKLVLNGKRPYEGLAMQSLW